MLQKLLMKKIYNTFKRDRWSGHTTGKVQWQSDQRILPFPFGGFDSPSRRICGPGTDRQPTMGDILPFPSTV